MSKKAFLLLGFAPLCSLPITTIIKQGVNEQGPQADIYRLALQFEELNETKSHRLFSELDQDLGYVTHEQLGIDIPKINNLNVRLQIISKNVNQKSVRVMYAITKPGFSEASGFITIFGSDAVEEPNNHDRTIVQQIISEFIAIQNTKNRHLYPHDWLSGQAIDLESLGIIEPQAHGATIEYRIKSVDLSWGQVVVEANVTKGQVSDYKIITINSFVTTRDFNLKIAEKILDHVPYNQPTTLKIFPKWKINDQVSGEDLHLNPLDRALQQYHEFKVSYLIKNINFAIGEITADAIVTKNGEIIKIKQEITIDHFLSQDEFDEDNIDDALEKISDITSTLNNQVPSWNINDIVTPQDLGIPSYELKNAEVQYKIIEVNDQKGFVKVAVSVKANNKTKTKNIIVDGFKSKNQDIQAIIDEVKARLVTKYSDINLRSDSPLKSKLPSELVDKMFVKLNDQDLLDFNIIKLSDDEKRKTEIEYKIVGYHDNFGDILIEVVISQEDISAAHLFKVQGFTTRGQRNQQLVKNTHDEIIKLNRIDENHHVIKLDDDSPFRKYLPSKLRIDVDDILDQKQLKNLNIILPNSLEVAIIVTMTKFSDDDGTVNLRIFIQKDDEVTTINLQVQGLRAKKIQDQFDVERIKEFLQDQYKDIHLAHDSNDKLKMPSEMQSDLSKKFLNKAELKRLNIEYPQLKKLGHVNVFYQIKTVSNGSGQIVIHVILSQGQAETSFDFIVKGFQTQNQRNKDIVKQLITNFDRDNANKVIAAENPLSQKTISECGYKLHETLLGQKLHNLQLIYNQNNLESEWEFKIINIDEKNGSMTLEVTAQKGLNLQKTTIKITGFKNELTNWN